MSELFEGIVAAKEHFAEDAADILIVDPFTARFQPVKGGHLARFVDDIIVVLGEIADLDMVADFDFPFVLSVARRRAFLAGWSSLCRYCR